MPDVSWAVSDLGFDFGFSVQTLRFGIMVLVFNFRVYDFGCYDDFNERKILRLHRLLPNNPTSLGVMRACLQLKVSLLADQLRAFMSLYKGLFRILSDHPRVHTLSCVHLPWTNSLPLMYSKNLRLNAPSVVCYFMKGIFNFREGGGGALNSRGRWLLGSCTPEGSSRGRTYIP